MGEKISVYLSSDTVMKINKEHILSIPLDGMAVVEMAKIEAGKTILLVTGCAAGILVGGLLAIVVIVMIGGGI